MDPVAPAAPAGPSAPSQSSTGSASSSSSSSSGAQSSPSGTQQQSNGGSGNGAQQNVSNPVAQQRLKRSLTIDGKQTELEASEDELWNSHRKVRTADQRFEQASKLRKEAEEQQRTYSERIARLKADPRAVVEFLREQGIENPLEHVANALQAEMAEEERLSDPNVRARVEAEKELAGYKQKELDQQQQQKLQVFEQEVERELDAISGTFVEALELSGLPKDDDTLAIMAQLESVNRHNGFKLEPKQLAKLTAERVIGRGSKVMMSMSDEQILKANPALTARFMKAIHADLLAKQAAKKGVPLPARGNEAASPRVDPAGPKQRVSDEYDLIGNGKTKILRSI